MVEKITIQKCIDQNFVFFDTRTPNEFAEDHIPGAISLPLFSNEERAIVGTIYKQVGKEQAIEEGIKYFSAKLDTFFKEVKQYKQQKIVIYCWRGGMRSKAVASFLESIGFDVFQLEGGHKAYRTYVREQLPKISLPKNILVLWGLTGVGKTELLITLKKQEYNTLDLEGLAQHRSSMFGGIGLKPRTQKMFESYLFQALKTLENKNYVFTEGESKKIGNVQIPDFLMESIKKGINIRVNENIEKRAKRITKEYYQDPEMIEEIKKIIPKTKQKVGKQQVQMMLNALEQKDFITTNKILLEYYYDPLYKYTIDAIKYESIITNDIEGLKKLKELVITI
ncbi:tRNA 2-selenouridine(34) synthase MnmH [Candidatus Woesearchaeota archaeon]|nr:tRNA 2-selenouridine(34) synthase MnmH [Candidatus Woesearchaeota archaeon]